MKNGLKFFICIVCFILILGGAKSGYEYLIENYEEKNDVEINTDNKDPVQNINSGDDIQNEIVEVNINKASDFEVVNANGEKVKLSDYFGKPIVVNFWATWCGPCQAEIPDFIEAYEKYGEEVEFMMVNLTDDQVDTVESVKQFMNKNNYNFPVYFDTEYSASNTYQVYSIPQTLFIDANGNLIHSHIGMLNKESLENKLEDIL